MAVGGTSAAYAAGQGQDYALFDKFLKEWYMEQWIDLFNNQTNTTKYVRRKIVPFHGRRMVIGIRTGESGAVQAIPLSGFNETSGTFGGGAQGAWKTVIPGAQSFDNAYVRPKIIMAGIQIPQDLIDSSEGDRASFYEVVDAEMQGIKISAAKLFDLMIYRGGRELADQVAGGTYTTTNIFVDNYFPFFKNKRVELWSSQTTGASERALASSADYLNVSIASRTYTANGYEITFSNAMSAASSAAEFPYTVGARTADTNLELTGLMEIINNQNMKLKNYENNLFYLGIDRTSVQDWQSQVVDLSGNALTFDVMQTMVDEIHDNSPGDANVIFTHRVVRRRYAKQIAFTGGAESAGAATFQFSNTHKFKMSMVDYQEDKHGAESDDFISFDGIPLIVDRYCPVTLAPTTNNNNGFMYFVDLRHLYMALVTDWRWWAPQGRILREAPNSAFGLVAHNYMMGELVCDLPSTCGVIKQIDCF
jgi:hypothetical protein